MRKFLWDGGASIAYSLAAVFFLASRAHNAEAGQKNAKTDQADQAPTTDKPRSTDFKATVSPKREALVHIDLGRVLETQGDYEGAVAEYANAVEVCKRKHSRKEGETPTKADYSLAHRRMAGAFDRMGDFQRSEMHYREALKLSPNDAKVWNDAGYSYYLQNRWPDAERSLKMAVKLDNQTPKYHINLGLAFAASGKTNEAVNELASVVGPAAAHANVGFVLAGRGNRALARKHYEEALRIQPDFQVARTALNRLDKDERSSSATVVASKNSKTKANDSDLRRASAATGIPLPNSLPNDESR